MTKEDVLGQIEHSGIIAVIRAENEEQALQITDACISGGIKKLELTFTIPHAHKIIESLASRFSSDDVLLGAGTVLDAQTARIALLSGAQFVVSPHFDPDILALCNRYRTLSMPGVMTISEAISAMNAGADLIKIFPADMFGPKIISAIKGPLPQAKMIPTGGVNLDNLHLWFDAGASAVGVCGSLLIGANTGDYKKIENTAKSFVRAIREYRQNKNNVI